MEKKETQINWYIGIDVSSATLDVSVCVTGQEKDPAHKRLPNDSNGFKEMPLALQYNLKVLPKAVNFGGKKKVTKAEVN